MNKFYKSYTSTNKIISGFVLLTFLFGQIGIPSLVNAQEIFLPAPGTMVGLSEGFNPPLLKGIKVYPDNPFLFDFILDKGDGKSSGRDDAERLVKYFLASLTTPEKEMWVNLSPYEKDRIVPESFGQTQMGRDLLAQDYMLKQITASLMYPENALGKKFWDRVQAQAKQKFGTPDIPVDTFNKVWIVPQKAVVYENPQSASAYILESSLKVMLEEDYEKTLTPPNPLFKKEGERADTFHQTPSLDKEEEGGVLTANAISRPPRPDALGTPSDVAQRSSVIREIILPELEKEVNFGKNFAQLRQIYNSLILAEWYKRKIKDSILSQVYVDKNKIAGVNIDDPQEKQKIYERYLEAFKKGAYNYIKEEVDPSTREIIPRKYFSGGATFLELRNRIKIVNKRTSSSVTSTLIAKAIRSIGLITIIVTLNILNVNDVQSQTNLQDNHSSISNLWENPVSRQALEDAIALKFNVPDSFLALPSKEPVTIETLEGYEIVPDAHVKLGTIIFQSGDYLGLEMIPQIASQLRNDVRIVIVVPNHLIARNLLNQLEHQGIINLEQRLRFVIGVSSSSWARDPYVVLYNSKSGQFTLLPSKGDAGTRLDNTVGWKLMNYNFGWKGLTKHNVHDQTLDMQGGDVTADDKYVYVGQYTLNISKLNLASQEINTEAVVINKIEQVTGKKVVILRGDDDIHNDRYHMPLGKTKYGEHTSLLSDPLETLRLLSVMTDSQKKIAIDTILKYSEEMPNQFKSSVNQETLRAFFTVTPQRIEELKNSKLVHDLNRMASDLSERGIVVLRIPGLPFGLKDVPFGIYPTNVIMDYPSANDEANRMNPSVILPHYGIGVLDEAVDAIYRDLGFELHPIMGILPGFLEGGPRCLNQTIGIPTKVINSLPVSEIPDLFLKISPPVNLSPNLKENQMSIRPNSIHKGNTGGIDLDAEKLNLQTRSSGGEIKFQINPAQLREFQNAPGFVPVIINIQPLINLPLFLGLKDSQPMTVAAAKE